MAATRRTRTQAAEYAVTRDGSDEVFQVVTYSTAPPPHVLAAWARKGCVLAPVGAASATAIIRNPAAFCVRDGKCQRRARGVKEGQP